MLLADRLALLLLEPVTGRLALQRLENSADRLCAAALLFDLVAQQRLAADAAGLLHLSTDLPCNHALLTAAVAALTTLPDGGFGVPAALRQIERRLAPLSRTLFEGLFRRDQLHRLRDWRFWRGATLRYPLRSWQARNDAIASLRQASQGQGGTAGLGLLVLTDAAGLLATHLDAHHHEQAIRLLLQLNAASAQTDPLAGAVLIRKALLA